MAEKQMWHDGPLHALPAAEAFPRLFLPASPLVQRPPDAEIIAEGAFVAWHYVFGETDNSFPPRDERLRLGQQLLDSGKYASTAMETYLKDLMEDTFHEIVARLDVGGSSPQQRNVLRRLPFILGARHPEIERHVNDWIEETLDRANSAMARDDEWLHHLAVPGGNEFRRFVDDVIRAVAHAGTLTIAGGGTNRWPATICQSASKRFVLGDKPAVAWRKACPEQCGTLGNAGVQICIPLTPLRAVQFEWIGAAGTGCLTPDMVDDSVPLGVKPVGPDFVDRVNLAQIAHAHDVVVAAEDGDFPAGM